jgi:hypothetical protein
MISLEGFFCNEGYIAKFQPPTKNRVYLKYIFNIQNVNLLYKQNKLLEGGTMKHIT